MPLLLHRQAISIEAQFQNEIDSQNMEITFEVNQTNIFFLGNEPKNVHISMKIVEVPWKKLIITPGPVPMSILRRV